jgi:hypothetical protein
MMTMGREATAGRSDPERSERTLFLRFREKDLPELPKLQRIQIEICHYEQFGVKTTSAIFGQFWY